MIAEPCLDDAERERRRRGANLRRKKAMLAFHASQRDPITGKSLSAVKGGQAAAGKRIAKTPGGARALGLELALARWYGGQVQ